MNKYFIPFLLIASCFITACRDDFYEPDSAPAEAITLSVNDAGFTAGDGTGSRSLDTDGVTVFEAGDTVGLIILDALDQILVDNVPYTFDGSKWDFCTGNTEGKQCAYFDKAMARYIVYYPYSKSADNAKSEKELLKSEGLMWREDQSTEYSFRHTDVMIWTYSGAPVKEIKADMKHLRNSLSLDLKVNYTISLKDDDGKPVAINYHPKRLNLNRDTITSYFEDFTLFMDNVMILHKTYNAQEKNGLARIHKEDGSYRYILPDGCSSSFRWRYHYKGKTYGGACQASTTDKNTRYKNEETIYMGDLSGGNILPGDYYCTRMVGDVLTGYVLPRDALEMLPENRCVGIVFKSGQEASDTLMKYPDRIYPENPGKCHGYAVALTNASLSLVPWLANSIYQSTYMGTSIRSDYNGYYNCETIMSKSEYKNAPVYFPAVKLCHEYGDEFLQTLKAPYNSSGWYLPAIDQLNEVNNQCNQEKNVSISFNHVAAINDIPEFEYVKDYGIHFDSSNSSTFWSSNEGTDIKSLNALAIGRGHTSKDTPCGVRPVLSF